MIQTFFLVILPGLGLTLLEVLPVLILIYVVLRWVPPYIGKLTATRRVLSDETRSAVKYRAAAQPVISQLAVQIEINPVLKKEIPADLQNDIYNIVNQEDE